MSMFLWNKLCSIEIILFLKHLLQVMEKSNLGLFISPLDTFYL